ncbi:MAG: cell division topological specificity factor MinE [Bradyrhizobium sp.]|nr:cell division topological specificity factor MinE [Bradyrhizobium sp.]
MSLFNMWGRRSSAPVARERLQILLAHERALIGQTDLVAVLREEILAVICRHVPVEDDKVRVTMSRGETVSTLEIDIEVPTALARPAA